MVTASIQAQCFNEITVPSGSTEQFLCADVTVTSAGSVDYHTFCNNIGPYWIGKDGPGRYTFSFSTPITGVILDFHKFDNHPGCVEEVGILINGAPFAITDAGGPSICDDLQTVVTPWGTLMCPSCLDPFGCWASCEGVQINQTITSITIWDNTIQGQSTGVNFSIFFCCGPCLTDAGVITAPALNLCPNAIATVPAATFTYLSPGDLLQYILFSDPDDTLGSIVLTSNTPNFVFNPTIMEEGTTYYIASIAGEELNGNVDLNSFCLDISNGLEVTWWPKPSVVFSTDNPNMCVGDCTTVTATFVGSPPFSLTYNTSISGTVTTIFQDYISTFEICTAINATPGTLLLNATSLTDAHCKCE